MTLYKQGKKKDEATLADIVKWCQENNFIMILDTKPKKTKEHKSYPPTDDEQPWDYWRRPTYLEEED